MSSLQTLCLKEKHHFTKYLVRSYILSNFQKMKSAHCYVCKGKIKIAILWAIRRLSMYVNRGIVNLGGCMGWWAPSIPHPSVVRRVSLEISSDGFSHTHASHSKNLLKWQAVDLTATTICQRQHLAARLAILTCRTRFHWQTNTRALRTSHQKFILTHTATKINNK